MQLRRLMYKIETTEALYRRRILVVEQERRERMFVSRANMYGLDRRLLANQNPRLDVQIAVLVGNEAKQRQNLADVCQLTQRRLERMWAEATMPGVPSASMSGVATRMHLPVPPGTASSSYTGRPVPVGVPDALRRRQHQQSSSPGRRRVEDLQPRRPSSSAASDAQQQQQQQRKQAQHQKEDDLASMIRIYGDPFAALEAQVAVMKAAVRQRKAELSARLVELNAAMADPFGQRRLMQLRKQARQQHEQREDERARSNVAATAFVASATPTAVAATPRRLGAAVVSIVPFPPPSPVHAAAAGGRRSLPSSAAAAAAKS